MRSRVDVTGPQNPEDPWDDPDAVVVYQPAFDEYGLPVRDGGSSMITIGHCPWCGVRLPESRRDAWFDEMQRRGIDPWEDAIPAEFHTDAWWSAEHVEQPAGREHREHVEPEKVIAPI